MVHILSADREPRTGGESGAMYQALYRKWRPRAFEDVVGQEHITGTLRRQVQQGRLRDRKSVV